MHILIIDNFSKHINQLRNIFYPHTITVVSVHEFILLEASSFDMFVLSGGSGYSVRRFAGTLYAQEIALIQKTTKPIIGICLGMQLISRAYGGELVRLEEKIQGTHTIEPQVENDIFNNMNSFSFYTSHNWAVQDLPSELVGLARSESGYEIIKHTHKPVYGFQFHPEVEEAQQNGKKIIANTLQVLTNHLQ
jgi:anthranilate/para-aminobenzoate synthase component II